jgi:hypothetical protein
MEVDTGIVFPAIVPQVLPHPSRATADFKELIVLADELQEVAQLPAPGDFAQ